MFDAVVIGKFLSVNQNYVNVRLSSNNLCGRGCHPKNKHRKEKPTKAGRMAAHGAAFAAALAANEALQAYKSARDITKPKGIRATLIDFVTRGTKIRPEFFRKRRVAKHLRPESLVKLMKETSNQGYPWQNVSYYHERASLFEWYCLPSKILNMTLRSMRVSEKYIPSHKLDKAKMILSITDLRDVYVSVVAQSQDLHGDIQIDRKVYDETYHLKELAKNEAKERKKVESAKRLKDEYISGKKVLTDLRKKGIDEDSAQVKALRKKVQKLGKRYFELEKSIEKIKSSKVPETAIELVEEETTKEEVEESNIIHEFDEDDATTHVAVKTFSPLHNDEEYLAGLYWILEALRTNVTIQKLEVRETRALCEGARRVAQWCADVFQNNYTLCDLWLGHRVLKVQELCRCRHLKEKQQQQEEEEEKNPEFRHVDDENFDVIKEIDLRPRRLHQDDRTLALEMIKMNQDLEILNGLNLNSLERCDLQNRKLYPYEVAFVCNKIRGHLDLKVLNLSNTELTPDKMVDICKAIKGNRALIRLDVSHNPIGSAAAVALIERLASRDTLKDLNLKCCEIGPSGMHRITTILAKANNFKNLKSLNLDGNEFDIASIVTLSAALREGRPCSLTSLSMSRSCLTDDSFEYISNALESSTCKLTSLDMSCNAISNRAVRILSKALRFNKVMQTLNLSQDSFSEANLRERYDEKSATRFDHQGVYEIAKMLECNRSIEFLMLTNVGVGKTGAITLGKSLKKNTTLKTLHIGHQAFINMNQEDNDVSCRHWQIGNDGASALWSFCCVLTDQHQFSLREIDLSCNGIGDQGILPLIEYLATNEKLRNTLVSLNLNNNKITGEIAKELVLCFSVPSIRKYICLKRNRIVNEDRALLRSKEKSDELNMHIIVDAPVILRPKPKKRHEYKLGTVTSEKRNVFMLAGTKK